MDKVNRDLQNTLINNNMIWVHFFLNKQGIIWEQLKAKSLEKLQFKIKTKSETKEEILS